MNKVVAALALALSQLVNINSGSGTAGVDQVQSWAGSELKKIGFEFEFKNHLLVATLKGDEKIITFVAHADTVFAPTSKFQKYTESGEMATGPGVIDDKGGLVVAVEGLKRFLKDHKSKHTLRFVSSPGEEIGSHEYLEQFKNFGKDSWLVLGFEPSLENGSIVSARRGSRWYHVTVTGKEAHSGRAHKEGINACNELSAKVAEISNFTNYAKDTTVSVGHIEGGQDKYNVVCGHAEAKIDTRFSSLSERDKLHARIVKVLASVHVKGAKTEFEIVDDSAPYSAGELTKPFVKKYLNAISASEHREVKAEASGGSADANFFAREGSIILDGLGATGGKMHTEEEFIKLPSLDTRAQALADFLNQI